MGPLFFGLTRNVERSSCQASKSKSMVSFVILSTDGYRCIGDMPSHTPSRPSNKRLARHTWMLS